ncbi:MAG: hypothetical protein ACI8W8_002702 [Rhodothermales bacterium]|jgi:hypothetical protein
MARRSEISAEDQFHLRVIPEDPDIVVEDAVRLLEDLLGAIKGCSLSEPIVPHVRGGYLVIMTCEEEQRIHVMATLHCGRFPPGM